MKWMVEVHYGVEIEYEEFDSRSEAEEFADSFYFGTEVRIYRIW